MKARIVIFLLFLSAMLVVSGAESRIRLLESFGDIKTVESAEKALKKGLTTLQKAGGGIIIIPPEAPMAMEVDNNTQIGRDKPGVTVIDYREGFVNYWLPQLGTFRTKVWAGQHLTRKLNMRQKSIPPFGVASNQAIQNYTISGASSYFGKLAESVKKGNDVRCYVYTISGVWVGQCLNVGENKRHEKRDVIHVKSIGWDNKKKMHYFTCDLKHDHLVGALIGNKNVVNNLQLEDFSNCGNQSMTFQVGRHQYSNGDSFVISGMLSYMGNIMQGYGDEMGVVINAETIGELDGFYSTVEAVDWSKDEITYAPGRVNAYTLSDQRPLINMNKKKWINKGNVKIVRPEEWGGMYINDPQLNEKQCIERGIYLNKLRLSFIKDGKKTSGLTTYERLPVKEIKYPYKGKAYPSILGGKPFKNHLGGAIIGSKDCGWTEDVVGRFFAITDKSEVIMPEDGTLGYAQAPKRPCYRWYQINGFYKNSDGTKVITILRTRWSTTKAGAPNLFVDDNYTWDGHERSLSYAIAPGAWVYSVADGWHDTMRSFGVAKNESRKIRVAPNAERGTNYDFAPGDTIEQAVGADPWHPAVVRVRHHDQLPSTGEGASFLVLNLSRAQIHDSISIGGGGLVREDLEKRKDKKAPFGTILNIGSLSDVGIKFRADFLESAIQFNQPKGHRQPIRWKNVEAKDNILQVNPQSGEFEFQGSGVNFGQQSAAEMQGISATRLQARNLRGINVSIKEGARTVEVIFSKPEPDSNYSITVQPNWRTDDWVSEKKADSFTVEFSNPAPSNSKIDWQLIR